MYKRQRLADSLAIATTVANDDGMPILDAEWFGALAGHGRQDGPISQAWIRLFDTDEAIHPHYQLYLATVGLELIDGQQVIDRTPWVSQDASGEWQLEPDPFSAVDSAGILLRWAIEDPAVASLAIVGETLNGRTGADVIAGRSAETAEGADLLAALTIAGTLDAQAASILSLIHI